MRAVTILSLALLAGCDSGVDSGPLAFGIVSGNNQTATAGSDRLTNPVVGKLVRTPDGGITFNLVRSAYAQGTVVNGSPVPGAVVCAVSISENGMVPWVPCTNTDSAGQATFFFTPGTRADTVRSEIRGTVEGEPAVFDTATAVVRPGPSASFVIVMTEEERTVSPDTVLDLRPYLSGRDEYNNITDGSDLTTMDSTQVSWHWEDAITKGSHCMPRVKRDGTGWNIVVPDFAADCYIAYQSRHQGELTLHIGGFFTRVKFYQPI
jgi:hypothetical protein